MLHYVALQDNPIIISINSLEYATQLITMLGCHLHFWDDAQSHRNPNRIFLLECDNMTDESWLKKGCSSSLIGSGLTRLQATLLLGNGVGYRFGCIDTKSNVIADGISCILSESSLSHHFPNFLSQAPSLNGCRCFLPNAALISLIVAVLLQTDSGDLLSVSRQLITNPRNFISFPGA